MPESYTVEDMLFEVLTPLGFWVHVTHRYWQLIVNVKHPVMQGQEEKVKHTLAHPEEIRLSRSDPAVYLFYTTEQVGRWVCAVAKRENNEGEKIWPK